MADKLERYEEKRPETVSEQEFIIPAVDIYENENELLLIADLPGVKKNNLRINIDNERLSIEGKLDEAASGALLGWEFQMGDYRRSFQIPSGIDVSKISADLKYGMLSLHLPKAEELKPRKIEVRAG